MSAESDYKCPICGYEWCAIPPSKCPQCNPQTATLWSKIRPLVEQICRDHAAHVEKENMALRKDRDCWIANANELQKAFNKLEKENAELKSALERFKAGDMQLELDALRGQNSELKAQVKKMREATK